MAREGRAVGELLRVERDRERQPLHRAVGRRAGGRRQRAKLVEPRRREAEQRRAVGGELPDALSDLLVAQHRASARHLERRHTVGPGAEACTAVKEQLDLGQPHHCLEPSN